MVCIQQRNIVAQTEKGTTSFDTLIYHRRVISRQLSSDIATIVHAQHKCLDISIRMAIIPASP